MIPTISIKSEPTDDNPEGFVVINLADFNADLHEAVEPVDLENLPVEQPRALTSQDVDNARAELERMHANIVAEQTRLDAQAGEQEAERARLAEVAAKLAEQGAETAKSLTVAELRDALTAKSIPFDPAAKKADLQALLDAAAQ